VDALQRAGESYVDPVEKKVRTGLECVRAAMRRDVVHKLKRVEVARRGREGRRAEVSDAGDVDRRADFIVDGRAETAARELEARLVERARRERRDETKGRGLVAVSERRAVAHCVEAADVARVETLDVV